MTARPAPAVLSLDTAAAATGLPAVTFVPFDASFGQHGVVRQPAGSALRPERMLGVPDGRFRCTCPAWPSVAERDGCVMLAAASAHNSGSLPGIARTLSVVRVTPDGTPDTSFSADGRLSVSFPDAGSHEPGRRAEPRR